MSASRRYDVVVIGAGHNGLVCAATLAKAGKSVLVLEAEAHVGGAAVTREFADGYSVSAGAHLLYQLQPSVCDALGIKLDVLADDLYTIVLSNDADPVRYRGGKVQGVSADDVASYRSFHQRLSGFAAVLNKQLLRPPPRLGVSGGRHWWSLARLGLDVRRLGRTEMREFLRLVSMNIRDELVERFSSPALRGALAADAVMGTRLGPRSPGSLLTYLYRMATGGRLQQPAGGVGQVSALLAERAQTLGVDIITGKAVRRVLVENGRVGGVECVGGERYDSFVVVSNADVKRTVLTLTGARHFETRFVHRVTHLRTDGNAAKLHLALDGLPSAAKLDTQDFEGRLLIAPDEDYVERAFNPAKYGQFSPQPVMEITFPSVGDTVLAPSGKHVMSAIVHYAPYALNGGWSDAARQQLTDAIINTLSDYFPDIAERVVASELLTPADIEQQFGITGGHWHHAELSLDQFMFVRPVAGAAQYQLPLDGLFLCGAGTHPGGGVSGAPGHNAAQAILQREKIAWS